MELLISQRLFQMYVLHTTEDTSESQKSIKQVHPTKKCQGPPRTLMVIQSPVQRVMTSVQQFIRLLR